MKRQSLNATRQMRAEDEAERKRDPEAYREKLALNRLRDVLSERWWTAGAAVYVIAGLHPDLTIGEPSPEWDPVWLPKSKNRYPDIKERYHADYMSRVIEHLGEVLDGATRSPKNWLKLCADFDLQPPWLETARSDALCDSLLPTRWRGGSNDATSKLPRGVAGGLARAEKDDRSRALREVREKHFPSWLEENLRDGKIRQGSRTTFAHDMVSHYERLGVTFTARAVQNKLKAWIDDATK